MTVGGQVRRAPGSRVGGEPWKGPRKLLATRLPLDEAAIVEARARAAGRSVSEYIADMLRVAMTRA